MTKKNGNLNFVSVFFPFDVVLLLAMPCHAMPVQTECMRRSDDRKTATKKAETITSRVRFLCECPRIVLNDAVHRSCVSACAERARESIDDGMCKFPHEPIHASKSRTHRGVRGPRALVCVRRSVRPARAVGHSARTIHNATSVARFWPHSVARFSFFFFLVFSISFLASAVRRRIANVARHLVS